MKIQLLIILLSIVSEHSYSKSSFITEPTFKTKVRIQELGSEHKQSMLLVHGLGENAAKDWNPITKKLAEQFHLILIDLPGFGESVQSPSPYSPKNYAMLLSFVLDKYSKSKKAIVMGHSLGGATALRFAHEFPNKINKLILIDPAGILYRSIFIKHISHLKKEKKTSNLLSGFINKLKKTANIVTENVIEFTDTFSNVQNILLDNAKARNSLVKDKVALHTAIALIEENFTDAIDYIKIPTLILWGRDDGVSPLRVGKILHHHLSKSHLIVYDEVGHNPMAAIPEKLSSDILSWIEKQVITPNMVSLVSDRIYECDTQKDKTLTGGYSKILLQNCNDIKLVNVTTKELILDNSSAVLENVLIEGSEVGINADESVITATNLSINSKIAIKMDDSKMDLAGTQIKATIKAINPRGSNLIYWSVSRIKEPNKTEQILHSRQVY
jgi:pimeloyl-ACP methyl ester carboxylesterase